MDKMSLLQSFAIDKAGRMRSVQEVERGLECDCICPTCGEPLLARQGEVREWHFAHASGSECDGAAEGALHLAAKQLIVDSKGMMVPGLSATAQAKLPDGRIGTGEASCPESWMDFEVVEEEKPYGAIRPDLTASVGDETLFIEVAVTHYIDDDKRATLQHMLIPTIEIDLGRIEWKQWDWELLREVVLERVDHKEWVISPQMMKDVEAEAYRLAVQEAMSSALPVLVPKYNKPPKTRYRVGDGIVDVTERPFGLTVWSPYNAALIEIVKPLYKNLGGRWKPVFKNWIIPLEAKEHLMSELEVLSGLPPERMKP